MLCLASFNMNLCSTGLNNALLDSSSMNLDSICLNSPPTRCSMHLDSTGLNNVLLDSSSINLDSIGLNNPPSYEV